jgi:citrate/tricarballylate utilization protein
VQSAELLREADRVMTVCNACRYCEGLCAVFPAMEMRRTFTAGDLNYLANLCHQCGACYYNCQYAPPHAFAINVPETFARLRVETYKRYAWPGALSAAFERNGVAIALLTALSLAGFLLGFSAVRDPDVLFGTHVGPGAFYVLMPHNLMAGLFGAVALYVIVALGFSLRAFWKDAQGSIQVPADAASLWRAAADAGRLRYLEGGAGGCMNEDERPTDNRRLYHHFTFYGFLLCFAATVVATLMHYGLGWEAPYAWYSAPVVLGTVGGLGLLVGPAGLLAAKWRRDRDIAAGDRFGMDAAFLVMLFLTSLTGLLLLVLRGTGAMGVLLAIHLAVVLALFLSMPYGKFVHGLYRFAALAKYAGERRAGRFLGQE